MRRRWAVPIVAASGLAFMALSQPISREVLVALAFGWVRYLARTLPEVGVDRAGVVTAVVCLGLFVTGAHRMLGWLWDQGGSTDEPRRPWSPRWSLAATSLAVLMFVAGVAATGIVHQAAWIARSPQPRLDYRLDLEPSFNSEWNLRQTGISVLQFASTKGSFPEGQMVDQDGRPVHGWQTLILPYMAYSNEGIDLKIPWDDPRNATGFKRFVPSYLNPEIGTIRDPRGFALSHYAGNVHVLGGTRPIEPRDFRDGAANTLMIGEVAADFHPWGEPVRGRDPADGINRYVDGFSGPSATGAWFVFADGSARFLRKDIDPRVLRALGTPAGGEEVAPPPE